MDGFTFADLFEGRTAEYGSWEGGCVREHVTPELFEEHLAGVTGVGIYPAIDGDVCFWGCVDIDFDDIAIAVNIQTALATQGITTWTERTRKGYHVWLFADEAVPLADMRRCLQAACAVVGYSPKEVNPKQEHLAEGQIGNYVRLPYFKGDDCFERYVFVYNTEERFSARLTVAEFAEGALGTLNKPETIAAVASLYTPPEPSGATVTSTIDDEGTLKILNRLDGLSYTIWKDGPLEGSDRSSTLARLAHKLLALGVTPNEAFAVLKSADARWGKFHARPDGDEQLMKLVERVF